MKPAAKAPVKTVSKPALKTGVASALEWLKKHGTKANRENMGPRYGITAEKAFGVSMANLKVLAKRLGRDHDLAAALWETGWYEARMLASLIDEPERVTPAQMDRWCRDFDNWAICDTVCFHLFDRAPQAFRKVVQWHAKRDEFIRRGAFALLACLALHDKAAEDAPFLDGLAYIEHAAVDERNFVKKAVSWALRAIGGRNPVLRAAALELALRLEDSPHPAARWIGKDAVKALDKKPAGKTAQR